MADNTITADSVFTEYSTDISVETFAKENPKEKPDITEKTVSGIYDEWDNDWQNYNTNPDDLLNVKGWSYYKEIAGDDTVHCCLELKKTGRLSTNWRIEPASESVEDKKIAAFVEYCFKNMNGTFKDILKRIYSAIDYGYSVSEKNYCIFNEGEWKGKIGYKNIKTRDPEHMRFKTDKHGNITKVLQLADSIPSLKKDVFIPRDKCIVYTYNSDFFDPYGNADVKYVHKVYLAKKWTQKFWNIAQERFGMGIMIGKYPTGDPNAKDDLLKMFENMSAKTSFAIPDNFEVDIKNIMQGGKMAYEFALEKHETAIARAMLIPDLLGFSKFTKGSFALGQKHFDVFMWNLDDVGIDTEETIVDEQMIKDLIKKNYGNIPIPHFKFDPLSRESVAAIFEQWNNLAADGAVTFTPEDEIHMRRLAGFPIRTIEEIRKDKEEQKEEKEKNQEKWQENIKKQQEQNGEEEKEDEKDNGKFAKESPRKYKIQKVMKFAQIKKDWDEIENAAIAELEQIFQKSKEGFYKDLDKKQLLNVDSPPNPTEIDKLQLNNKGEIKKTLKNAMLLGYLYKRANAINEMRSVNEVVAGLFKKDIPIPAFELMGEFNVKAEKAIEHFSKKMVIKRSELKQYTRKAFTLTGAENNRILDKAKGILEQHLTRGNRKKTEKALRKLWDKYETTGALTDKGKLSTAHRIDTIVRNNVSEAMSEGRMRMYEDPQIAGEIAAYGVDVTLDDNTTDYCQSLVGKTWAKDEFYPPPYHHKCRTEGPVPIFRGEEHTLKNWKESPYEFY